MSRAAVEIELELSIIVQSRARLYEELIKTCGKHQKLT